MSIESAGAFFGLLDPFARVAQYLRGVKEDREIRQRLTRVLTSLNTFDRSGEASRRTGRLLRDKAKSIQPPITPEELAGLMTLSVEFNDQFRLFLSSICEFGRECKDLNSGDFEAFMQKVKARKPEVYDIMNFFGRNYDSQHRTLDLTRLPTLIRTYSSKVEWKESKKISEEVAEGRKEVEELMKKVKVLRSQRIPFHDRALLVSYIRSYQRLGREGKRFIISKSTVRDLQAAAPSWYVELVGITSLVKKSLPSGMRHGQAQ